MIILLADATVIAQRYHQNKCRKFIFFSSNQRPFLVIKQLHICAQTEYSTRSFRPRIFGIQFACIVWPKQKYPGNATIEKGLLIVWRRENCLYHCCPKCYQPTYGLIKHSRFGRNGFNCGKFEWLARDRLFSFLWVLSMLYRSLSIKSETESKSRRITKTIAAVEIEFSKFSRLHFFRTSTLRLLTISSLCDWFSAVLTVPTVNDHDSKIKKTTTNTHLLHVTHSELLFFFCSLCSPFR